MAWKIPFSRGPRDEEFDAEIAFHIDQLTQAGIAEGLTPEEARRRAILEFGGREQVKAGGPRGARVGPAGEHRVQLESGHALLTPLSVLFGCGCSHAGGRHRRKQRGVLGCRCSDTALSTLSRWRPACRPVAAGLVAS